MASLLPQRKVARVLFDESHSEAWTIRPEVAAQMQPGHPGDASYAKAAAALADRDFTVAAAIEGALSDEHLAKADVLVIAHPADTRWERTAGEASPVFAGDEIRAIQQFVARGGGLIVLGETEEAKYGSNLDELLAPFGIRFENTTVFDHTHYRNTPTWVLGQAAAGAPAGLLHLVAEVCFYRTGTLRVDNDRAVLLETSDAADPSRAPLLAATSYGEGRVVVAADSDLFGDDSIGDLDHERLWLNLLYWVAAAAFKVEPPADRVGGAAGSRLAPPQGRDQRAASPAGAQGRGRPVRSTTSPRCAPTSRR